MKTDVLLFTQVMHSLLSSYLSLQNALTVCKEILTGQKEKAFVENVLKTVNEGKKFSHALAEYKKDFSPLYISLISIGEESGTLAQVFGHLSIYLKAKKNMRRKIIQALLYPCLVLFTAVAVVIILTVFVMPRLEGIFEAFEVSSSDMAGQILKIKSRFILTVIIMSLFVLFFIISATLRKVNEKAAYLIDSILLKIPVVNNLVLTMQMNDFSFAMKLLSDSHYPLVRSLLEAEHVLDNRKMKKAVSGACKSIMDGQKVGEAFEREMLFPKYFTVWVKIAEENGNTSEAFGEISDYYQNENENILESVTQAAEPVFIIITGAIIISIILQFVIPVFNLLGAL